MTDTREQMSQALKDVVVPVLRERGFTDTFPHFRRRQPDRIDLFTFQFDRHGGGFIIEIGRCEPTGFTTHWGKQIGPAKVTAWDLPPKQRSRIKPRDGTGTDSWFRFDSGGADIFRRIAELVVPFVEQAERMFGDFDQVQKLG
jgi:hypothetical protein